MPMKGLLVKDKAAPRCLRLLYRVRCGLPSALRSGFEPHSVVDPPWGFGAPSGFERLRRSSPVLSMELHTSLGRRRVLLLPANLHLRAFQPPPALLRLPEARSSERTGLWRAQDSASDTGAALNFLGLARYLARFRGRLGLRLSHWQSQQRESYQHHGLNESYPGLTLVTDKRRIFC